MPWRQEGKMVAGNNVIHVKLPAHGPRLEPFQAKTS